jgi:hypothetical protein
VVAVNAPLWIVICMLLAYGLVAWTLSRGNGWNAGIQDEHRWWARLAQSALLGLVFFLSSSSVRSGLLVAVAFVLLTEALYWGVQRWRRWRIRRESIAA